MIKQFFLILRTVCEDNNKNKYKNGKDLCDYQCGQKFAKDMFVEPKMEVCKANCDVVWDNNFIKQIPIFVQGICSNNKKLDITIIFPYMPIHSIQNNRRF